MFAVGLTGGIACGKSTVRRMFEDYGIETFCADTIAKEAVSKGTKAFNQIVTRHGESILDHNGHLNRKALKQVIFDKPDEKQWLENLIHPIVREQLRQCASKAQSDYCILDIPLLNQTLIHQYNFIQKVITVEANQQQQLSRLAKRDHISKDLALKIIQAQPSRNDRACIADFQILNDHISYQTLKDKVDDIHQQLIRLTH